MKIIGINGKLVSPANIEPKHMVISLKLVVLIVFSFSANGF